MRVLVAVGWIAVVGLAGAPAAAQVTNPDWLKRPNSSDLLQVWPAKALQEGRGGRAIIACIVTVQGTLRACKAEVEEPPGFGFAAAAVALAPQFLMKPATRDGKPVESEVRIPIVFKDPGPGAPRQTTGSHMRVDPPKTPTRNKIYANLPYQSAPSFADVLAAYPAKARAEKVSGVVAMECRIGRDARLGGCKVGQEQPRGYGFGPAARALAPAFVAPTQDSQGDSMVGALTHLSITFAAQALENPTPVIGRPRWISLPQPSDLAAVVPEAARKASAYKARVVMSCKVAQGGYLEGCTPVSEEPTGLGFGQAAVSLARSFKLAVWTEEGLPAVGGSVRIPIRFDLEEVMKDAAPR